MRVFRISNFMAFGVAIILSVLLFWTSQAVHQKEDDLKSIQENLNHEKEAMMVLGVEWDYLNRPQRLEKLASEQLGMILPTSGGVAKSIDEIEEPVLVNLAPKVFEQTVIKPMPVSSTYEIPKSTKQDDVVSPSKAEKQSFESLIQSLDTQNGDAP